MKLPRDLSGPQVVKLLEQHYGYRQTRTRGSHITITLTTRNDSRSITVPRHRNLSVGTLDAITADVAAFLGLPKRQVHKTLFR